MKQNNTTRIFYTILVPVILVVAVMNSGFLQARLPAVTINGTGYNVAQFNFYYFTLYQEYLSENFDENGDNGPFDASVSLKTQYLEDGTSWKDYFTQLAIEWMAEVACYTDAAQAAGYSFSQEELAPIQAQLDAIEVSRTANSISLKNYLVAYWGVGMTEAVYTQELTRATQAQAYKDYLTQAYTPDQTDIQTWLDENPQTDYLIAGLKVITLEALTDRTSGQTEDTQLEALRQKLSQLEQRYQSGTDPEELQQSFSTCALGDEEGTLLVYDEEGIPEEIALWCLSTQEIRSTGDTLSFVDEENGVAYFVYFQGYQGSSAEYKAIQALSLAAIEAQTLLTVEQYEITESSIGMRLAAS